MAVKFPGHRKTIEVTHLGGIRASYHISEPFDKSRPTIVLINSFTTSADLYEPQFNDSNVTSKLNLLAIEPLGHGNTRIIGPTSQFTYWDSAIMNLQVLKGLGIEKAWALGTSQGGWIAARMALIASDKISGLILLGTSLDYESTRSQEAGCWNAAEALSVVLQFTHPSTGGPSWTIPEAFHASINASGFGGQLTEEQQAYWAEVTTRNYAGEEGRQRLRQAAVNLITRDGLYLRLEAITCPVLRMHGDQDMVYSVLNSQEEMQLLVNSSDKQFVEVKGGSHYLSASKPQEINTKMIEFIFRQSPRL